MLQTKWWAFAAIFITCHAIVPFAQPTDFLFFHLTQDDGLASNMTFAVAQDKQGFIWFGTMNGLQRYDGKKFQTYRHLIGDSTSLPGNSVNALFFDRQGQLWLSASEKLCRYDAVHDQFIRAYSKDGEILTGHPTAFTQDVNDVIWMASFQKGIYRLFPGKEIWEKVSLPFFATPKLMDGVIAEDKETGDLWFATWTGVVLFDQKSNQFFHSKTHPTQHPAFKHVGQPHRIFIDQSNNLWILNWNLDSFYCKELLKYNLRTGAVRTYPICPFLNGIFQDSKGNIYMGGGQGSPFYKYDSSLDSFFIIPPQPNDKFGLAYGFGGTNMTLEDHEHNLWLAGDMGVHVFNPQKQHINALRFVPKPDGNNEPLQHILCFLETKKGEIWAGTYFNGLYVFDQNFHLLRKIKYAAANQKLDLDAAWAMCQDSRGNIWVGGQHGTVQLFDAKGELIRKWVVPETQNRTIQTITEDEHGNIWLGGYFGFLLKRDAQKGTFSQYPDNQNIQPEDRNIVLQIFSDKIGSLWVATNEGTLRRLDIATGKYSGTWRPSDYIPGESKTKFGVHGITPWNDSLLLIHGNPLYFFNKNSLKFSLVKGLEKLPTDRVILLQKTAPDQIWLGYQTGLAKWNPQTGDVIIYSNQDGIPTDELGAVNSSIRLGDGRILISGGDDGFFSFHPDSLAGHDIPPDVILTGLKIMNRSIRLDSALAGRGFLALDHDTNFITIEFASLSWLQRDQITYRYQLVGYDKDWVNGSNQRFATYTGLPPGQYTFKVMAVNREGICSTKITELGIHIRPPFWQTWWFIFLSILAFGGVIWWSISTYFRRKSHIFQLKMENRLALERERSRIAAEMHDDLGSGLAKIKFLSEALKLPRGSSGPSDKIVASATELLERMNEIIWAMSQKNDSLENLVAYCRGYTMEFCETSHIKCRFDLPPEIPNQYISGEARRNIFLILKESLHNTVKHAEASQVVVSIHFNGFLEITIQDNGKGFEPTTTSTSWKGGNGILNMRRRAESIKGEFSIENLAGTLVRLKVPLSDSSTV